MSSAVPHQQISAAQKLAAVNEQTWLTMGNLAEMMTDYDKAMNCYESALRHNPYSIPALSQIASLCRGREQFGRAVEYFKRILSIQENNGETWAALGHCYLMMDNLQEAYHAYQQALYHLSNPKDPKLWYGIGILYDRYGSLEHAEEAFSAVMKMDPKFEKANEIYFRLGIIYKQQQKFDLSLQCFRYILHSPPRPLTESDIWFQTGHVYEQQKEYELAKEAYERVLAENPDHAKVLQQLGWLYHQQNTSFCNQNLAIQYLTRSLKSDSNDAQSWYLLGRCYMAEQNYNKAYEAYQQAVYRDARNPTFWCSIGVLYYQINQYRDALDAYSRAIRLNPYISEVWYDLGTLYESCNNQIQDALDAYHRAAELDPSNPHIKQRLELLRKSQGAQPSQTAGNAPVPQDVSNPSQYQNGANAQPLNGAGYGQSAPSGPPASMSAYHTAVGGSQRPPVDDRVPTPQLPMVNHHGMPGHEGSVPPRDLPTLGGGPPGRHSPGPYSQYQTPTPREDVRIPGIGGGRASTPSERSPMNPVHPEDAARQHRQQPSSGSMMPPSSQANLPPMSVGQSLYAKPEMRSPDVPPHMDTSRNGRSPAHLTAQSPTSRPPQIPAPAMKAPSQYEQGPQHHLSSRPEHHGDPYHGHYDHHPSASLPPAQQRPLPPAREYESSPHPRMPGRPTEMSSPYPPKLVSPYSAPQESPHRTPIMHHEESSRSASYPTSSPYPESAPSVSGPAPAPSGPMAQATEGMDESRKPERDEPPARRPVTPSHEYGRPSETRSPSNDYRRYPAPPSSAAVDMHHEEHDMTPKSKEGVSASPTTSSPQTATAPTAAASSTMETNKPATAPSRQLDEDYDESVADTLLSMGRAPQTAIKRSFSQEAEGEHKKLKSDDHQAQNEVKSASDVQQRESSAEKAHGSPVKERHETTSSEEPSREVKSASNADTNMETDDKHASSSDNGGERNTKESVSPSTERPPVGSA